MMYPEVPPLLRGYEGMKSDLLPGNIGMVECEDYLQALVHALDVLARRLGSWCRSMKSSSMLYIIDSSSSRWSAIKMDRTTTEYMFNSFSEESPALTWMAEVPTGDNGEGGPSSIYPFFLLSFLNAFLHVKLRVLIGNMGQSILNVKFL